MLKKRLWTALLALMAVVGMAGGALAATGDATFSLTFSNPDNLQEEFHFLPEPNVHRQDLENGTWTRPTYNITPNGKGKYDVTINISETDFQSIYTDVPPNAATLYSNLNAVLTATKIGGFFTPTLKYGAAYNNSTMSIAVKETDGVDCEGYFLFSGTNGQSGTYTKNALTQAVSPMNPVDDEVEYGTVYLIFKSQTDANKGYYVPIKFIPYQTGIINLTTDEGNTLSSSNTNEFPEGALLIGGYSEPIKDGEYNAVKHVPHPESRLYPDAGLLADDDTQATDAIMTALKTELESDYALTLSIPKGGKTASLTSVRNISEEQGVVPGNLKYVENGVLKTIKFDNTGKVTGLKPGTTYYLQVNIQGPDGWVASGRTTYNNTNPWDASIYTNDYKQVYRVQLNVREDQAAVTLTAPTSAKVGEAAVFSFKATGSDGQLLPTASANYLTAKASIGSTAQTATVAMTSAGAGTVKVTPTTDGTLTVTLTLADRTTVTATGTVTVAVAGGGESGSGSGSGSGTTSGDKKPDEKPTDSGTTSGNKKPDEKPTDSGGTPVTPVKTAVTLTPATGATAPTVKAGAETTVTFTVSPDVAGKAEVKVADTSIATATAAYRTVSTAAASGGTVSVAVKGVKAGMTKATLTFTPTDSTRYTAPAAVTLNITVTASGSSSEPDGPTSDKDSDTEKKAEAILENLDTSTPGGAAMAEKLSNPEDKAAAVDAVEALERAGTDVSTLSSKDVEALVQNKKAEEADKEKEKSGSVSDPTVPAASELLDSATALSVSPKVVKPTPVTNEAVLADMKTGIENFTAEKDSGVDSSAVTAAKEGLQTADTIDIADAATSLTEQTKVVEDLFNMVSADLTKFGSNGVVIATVLPKMTPKASGFFPLSVNLRHLTPGRVLRFWLSPAAFTKKATGSVSVAEATEGQYFFLDENGVPTSVVTGDPAKMKLVVYLTAVQSASLAADQPVEGAFITVDGTPDDKTTLEEMTKSDSSGEGGEGGGNSDGPTSNKGSGGCDALSGGLALLALIPLFMRKRS